MVSVKLTGGKKERNPHSEKGENIREGQNTGGKKERERERVKGNATVHRAKIKIEDEKW